MKQIEPLVWRAENELANAKTAVAANAILDELVEEAALYAETH